jgi:hypothetical protein
MPLMGEPPEPGWYGHPHDPPASGQGRQPAGARGGDSSRVPGILDRRLWGAPRAVWAGAAGLLVIVLAIMIAVVASGNGTPRSTSAACQKIKNLATQSEAAFGSFAGGSSGSQITVTDPQKAVSQMRHFVSNFQQAAQLAPSGSALQQALNGFVTAANNLITDMADNRASAFSTDFTALTRYSTTMASICHISSS